MAKSVQVKLVIFSCVVVCSFTTLLLRRPFDTQSYTSWRSRGVTNSDLKSDTVNDREIQPPFLYPPYSSRYGKPILGKDIVVVYTRVPKTGSRTMVSLAKALAPKNNYKKPRPIFLPPQLNEYETVRTSIVSTRSPAFIDGHTFFMDMKDDNKYAFISFVRDPLEREISRYYFTRYGDDKITDVEKLRNITKPKFVHETFDECVLRKRDACNTFSNQLGFLCGYHPRCRIPSRWAVEEAKSNINKYLLVGVTEQYSDSLQMLEHLLPDFFKGLMDEYRKPTDENMTLLTKSKNKLAPSKIVVEIMKEKLKYEYEVYNYAVKKFNRLKRDVFD